MSFNQLEIAAAQPAGNTEVGGHTDVTLINTRCQLADHCSLIVPSHPTGVSVDEQVKGQTFCFFCSEFVLTMSPSADTSSPDDK